MSKTLQISDGDLYISKSTGSARELFGEEKLSQDIAESLLLHFDLKRNYGNTMNVTGVQPALIGQVSQLDVRERIQSAIDRLQNKQFEDKNLTEDEEIDSITNLEIDVSNDNTEVRFFLEVSTVRSRPVTAAGIIQLQPVKLDHVNPPDLFKPSMETDPLKDFVTKINL